MRALAVVLAGSLLATGCATNSYQIPNGELARLAIAPPEVRGQHVRVIQDVLASDAPAATPVTGEARIEVGTQVYLGGGGTRRGVARPARAGGGKLGGGKLGGAGNDGKGAAVAILFLAATALVTAAVIEGTRFDGYAQLHPMHPVHLFGRDGGYTVLPLAQIDPGTAAWTARATVRSTEGPWLTLERAPLSRRGLSYGMYGGTGSLRSADGTLGMGPACTVQLGVFPTQTVGLFGSLFFGWRDNRYGETLFETRTTAEIQVLPVQLGILHGGLYGGLGVAHRIEDGIKLATNDRTTSALVGGAMLQLDVNTRIALTARLGIARAHGEEMQDVILGLSVY